MAFRFLCFWCSLVGSANTCSTRLCSDRFRKKTCGARVVLPTSEHHKPQNQRACTVQETVLSCRCFRFAAHRRAQQIHKSKCYVWLLASLRTPSCAANICAAHKRAPHPQKNKLPHMVAFNFLWCTCLHCPPASTSNPKNKMTRMVACTSLVAQMFALHTSEQSKPENKTPCMVAHTVKETVLWCTCLCCPPLSATNPKNKCHALLLVPFWTRSCGASVCPAHP